MDRRDIEERISDLWKRRGDVSGEIRYLEGEKRRYESEAIDAGREEVREGREFKWDRIQPVWDSSDKAKSLEKLEAEKREIVWKIRVLEAKKLLCRE